ncbi:MAG: B12-binding domain-containing radical SAM protein [Polyangiaceae bacterium]|nr:B12-binding domain-containing radical SAM protein [Polyangiaceae bacterium]
MSQSWVALVGPEVEENLSLRYLAAALAQSGIRSEIHAFNAPEDFSRIAKAILDAPVPPLLVGLSLAFQWRAEEFLALAMALRAGGYRGHVTGGGHFGTFAANELLRDFLELDSICRFEAESTIVELVRALERDRPLDDVSGLVLRRGGVVKVTAPRGLPDVKALPWPDRRGAPARCFGHAIAPLVGSRGCYGRCSFCSIAAWHDAASSSRRFRLRDVADVADEMAELQRGRGIEIFLFEDDNFFLPRPEASLARIHGLADALAARGVDHFATMVKARADDVRTELFEPLVRRLHCLRAYVGIESHADSGLLTLARNARPSDNDSAMAVARQLGLYVCFNVLPFDPDATLESFVENVAFLDRVLDYPFCVGRVELYAGTPLLARLQREGRCRGDYLRWNYDLIEPRLERLFRRFMACQRDRYFSGEGAIQRLWVLRMDVEAARFFHPDRFRPAWHERAVALTRTVTTDAVAVLHALVAFARADVDEERPHTVHALARQARRVDAAVLEGILALAREMSESIGEAASVCEVNRVARERNPTLA